MIFMLLDQGAQLILVKIGKYFEIVVIILLIY